VSSEPLQSESDLDGHSEDEDGTDCDNIEVPEVDLGEDIRDCG